MALFTTGIHGPAGNPSGAQGGIIQIKQTIYKTDQTFNTQGSFFDTGLTCSITPTSSDNHVLVHCSLTFQPHNPASMVWKVLRGSTNLDIGNNVGARGLFAGTQDGSRGAYPNFLVLDTAIATTSATTYKVQVNVINADSRINGRDSDYRACSTMTLMEVSA